MSFISRRAIVPAATLLLATAANAQTCYYPDGKSIATDIPCDPSAPASSCCSSDSFCLADGLCYGGGIVSRGSCTDQSWKSPACAQYCRDDDQDRQIAITPCTSGSSSNTFVCGVNTTDCQSDANTFTLSSDTSLVLRPAQIAALVGDSLRSSAPQATVTSIPDGYYTGGAMAGLAIGVAIPLLVALGVMYMLLRRERQKFGHGKPDNKKLMYKLPDDLHDNDFTPKPPPPVTITQAPSFQSDRPGSHMSAATSATSMTGSRRASMRTIQTQSSRPVLSRDFPPNQSQTFLERYETMKRAAQVQSMEVSVVSGHTGHSSLAQELDSTPTKEHPRYELSDTRMSA